MEELVEKVFSENQVKVSQEGTRHPKQQISEVWLILRTG